MALTSTNAQAMIDDLNAEIALMAGNGIIKNIMYSAQIGMNMVLELIKTQEGVNSAAPNKGQACSTMMQSLGKTGTTKSVQGGTAYRFDKQWFRDNLQNGSLDLRTVYYLTEEVSGCILVIAGGSVNFDFVENDPTGATLTAKWDALQ